MNAGPRPSAGGRAAAGELAERPGRDHAVAGWRLEQIIERLPLAVDRVMGESGLWAPELAARALRQAQGDVPAAVHLLRVHRSALPRLARSEPGGARRTAGDPADQLRVPQSARRAGARPHPRLRGPAARPAAGGGGPELGREARQRVPPGDRHRERSERSRPSGTTDHGNPGTAITMTTSTDARSRPRPPGTRTPPMPRAGHPPASSGPRRTSSPCSARWGSSTRSRAEPVTPSRSTSPATRCWTGAPRSAWLQTMARADTGSLMHMWYGSDLRPRPVMRFPVKYGTGPSRSG